MNIIKTHRDLTICNAYMMRKIDKFQGLEALLVVTKKSVASQFFPQSVACILLNQFRSNFNSRTAKNWHTNVRTYKWEVQKIKMQYDHL